MLLQGLRCLDLLWQLREQLITRVGYTACNVMSWWVVTTCALPHKDRHSWHFGCGVKRMRLLLTEDWHWWRLVNHTEAVVVVICLLLVAQLANRGFASFYSRVKPTILELRTCGQLLFEWVRVVFQSGIHPCVCIFLRV